MCRSPRGRSVSAFRQLIAAKEEPSEPSLGYPEQEESEHELEQRLSKSPTEKQHSVGHSMGAAFFIAQRLKTVFRRVKFTPSGTASDEKEQTSQNAD